MNLTQSRLKEVLHYEPATGVFTWLVSRGNQKAGTPAGVAGRYVAIGVDGTTYRAHRLAFLYMLGYIPALIDHEDMDKCNNRWSNLRVASGSDNQANKRVTARNKLGVKGVSRNGKGFAAQLTKGGIKYRSTTYPTIEQAAEAYAELARIHHGEYARSAVA